MLNIGLSRVFVTIEAPVSDVDDMGAPTTTWATYATAFGELEGDQVMQDDGLSTGPRREVTRSSTLIIRCHPSEMFSPAMRVVTSDGQVMSISAVRYDSKHSRAYMDVQGGQSSGGVP